MMLERDREFTAEGRKIVFVKVRPARTSDLTGVQPFHFRNRQGIAAERLVQSLIVEGAVADHYNVINAPRKLIKQERQGRCPRHGRASNSVNSNIEGVEIALRIDERRPFPADCSFRERNKPYLAD